MVIIGLGVLAFNIIAIAQEWEVFAPLVGARVERGASTLRPEDRAAAIATVKRFLRLMIRLYTTGHDRRIAERLPVSSQIARELRADVAFLFHRRQLQRPRLVRLDVLRAEERGPRLVQVRTREYWIVRGVALRSDGRPATAPASAPVGAWIRPSVLRCQYVLERDGTGWRVRTWDVLPATAS